MGWVSDKPGHEGYIVGLTEVESSAGNGWTWWRELSPSAGDETPRAVVERFQAGCTCGWRSRVFLAPRKAEWFPYVVELNDAAMEDAARALWRRHDEEPEHAKPLCPAPGGR